jgi:hypothetical protein
VQALLLGPRVAARVVGATPRALYLGVSTPGRTLPGLVAVLAPDAVRVPFGIVLDAVTVAGRPVQALAAVGDVAEAGEGALRIADVVVRPLRWWDPGVPPLHAAAVPMAARLAGQLPGPPSDVAQALPELAAALHPTLHPALHPTLHPIAYPIAYRTSRSRPPGEARLAAAVRALIGLGPGLTPTGDDVLAGAMCALAAVRPQSPTRAALGQAVLGQTHRTTTISAALLAEAAQGRAVPQVVDVLRTLAGSDGPRVADAVSALVGVGHTSGTALGHGLVLGLRAAA